MLFQKPDELGAVAQADWPRKGHSSSGSFRAVIKLVIFALSDKRKLFREMRGARQCNGVAVLG